MGDDRSTTTTTTDRLPHVNGLPPALPPKIPRRSPLRPTKRISAAEPRIVELPAGDSIMPAAGGGGYLTSPSITALIDQQQQTKALTTTRPDSPIMLSPLSSTDSSFIMTKRQHALHEVLESERAYASDLALVRDVYIPLAYGQPVAYPSPPTSSGSSSRTVSTASDSSVSSLGPPMTPDDAKIIFNNIVELAVFSDRFCNLLEIALASALDGSGEDDDAVGALFLEILPEMERPYNTYITRQRAADEHLQNLPKTPALEAYYAHTRAISTSISHAWDLHSLLIKPVQRFLKYPLLLNAIIIETPDTHPDKENLKCARMRVEEMARNVNEDSRRVEVVKGVLSSSKKTSRPSASTTALVKMKSIKSPTGRGGTTPNENEEAALVARLSTELHRIELFAQQFARNILDWAKQTSLLTLSLRTWSLSFSHVIGLSPTNTSEAFDAFYELIEKALLPLCVDLENAINERLLKDLAHLLTTMAKPLKLIASMEEQESMHHQLLNMPVSKSNRPPPSLLEASSNYIALRGQLAKELPRYVYLMDRAMGCFVRKLAEIQRAFYGDVRERWGELWDMLRVEGEINAGAEETVGVWWNRWGDVDLLVSALSITNPRKIYQEPIVPLPVNVYADSRPSLAPLKMGSSIHIADVIASLDPPPPSRKKKEMAKQSQVQGVVGMLMSLEPAHSPNVSHPYPLSPSSSVKSRGRGSSVSGSSEGLATRRSPGPTRRPSSDSLRSPPSRKHSPRRPSRRSGPAAAPAPLDFQDEVDFAEYMNAMGLSSSSSSASPPSSSSTAGALSRKKSMPLPLEPPQQVGETQTQRKPSFTRKLSEQLRPGSSSSSKQQHRPKTPSFDGVNNHPPSSFMQNHTHRLANSISVSSALGIPIPSPSPTTSSFPPHSQTHPAPLPAPAPTHPINRTQSKYPCRVVASFHPPYPVSYTCPFLLYPGPYPFLSLIEGEVVEVLEETGHPRTHPGLPLVLEEGDGRGGGGGQGGGGEEDDCLLLCRRVVPMESVNGGGGGYGDVGWALASFLQPLS